MHPDITSFDESITSSATPISICKLASTSAKTLALSSNAGSIVIILIQRGQPKVL